MLCWEAVKISTRHEWRRGTWAPPRSQLAQFEKCHLRKIKKLEKSKPAGSLRNATCEKKRRKKIGKSRSQQLAQFEKCHLREISAVGSRVQWVTALKISPRQLTRRGLSTAEFNRSLYVLKTAALTRTRNVSTDNLHCRA